RQWGGKRQDDCHEQARERKAQRVRVALGQQVCNGLVVADRASEVSAQNAFPIAEVLLTKRSVETEGMTRGSDVGGRGAFAEHQLDRISGDQGDEEEDQGDYEPDDWQGVEDALEEGIQAVGSRVGVILRGASAKAVAEAKDAFP